MRRDVFDDPIVQLMRDIKSEGRPSLTWMVEWAAEGSLQPAWDASQAPLYMALILGRLGFVDSGRFIEDDGVAGQERRTGTLKLRSTDGEIIDVRCALVDVPDQRYSIDPRAAQQIRGRFPTLIPLPVLLDLLERRTSQVAR